MTTGQSEGILLGGMGEDGTVLCEMYHWTLESSGTTFVIRLKNQSHNLGDSNRVVCRIGATVTSDHGLRWTLAGGLTSDGILPDKLQILHLEFHSSHASTKIQWQPADYDVSLSASRPLFIGHQAVQTSDGLAIIGGGANCFSFGTYWNSGLWLLSHDQEKIDWWREVEKDGSRGTSGTDNYANILPSSPIVSKPVQIVRLASGADFHEIVQAAKPVVVEGLALGACSDKWTLSYLKDAIGPDRQVRTSYSLQSRIDHTSYIVAHQFTYTDIANVVPSPRESLHV